MVKILRDNADVKSVSSPSLRQLQGKHIRVHLYADSAEGPRSGMDRALASARTASASARTRTKRAAA